MLGLKLNHISKREPWTDCQISMDTTPQQQSVKDMDNTLLSDNVYWKYCMWLSGHQDELLNINIFEN